MPIFPLQGGSKNTWGTELRNFFSQSSNLLTGWMIDPYVDCRNYASINAAVTAIGGSTKTLLIANAQTLTASLTVPSNIELKILNTGSIVKASTYTLTINGPFSAGLYQVFLGFSAGDVTFADGSIKEAYAEWFGGDIKKALYSWHVLQLLSSTYTMDYDVIGTIYLDSPVREKTYIIKGMGLGSFVYVDHYDTENYLFVSNQTSSGTKVVSFPAHPRVIIDGVWFYATASALHDGSTSARLLYFNEASFHLYNTRLNGFKWGATGAGYTDNVRLDMVAHINPVAGGWLYQQLSNGDGLFVRNIFASGVAGAGTMSISKCAGATLDSLVGGSYEFIRAYGIKIQGGHFEDSAQTVFTIYGSQVSIDSNSFHNNAGYGYTPIVIDDTDSLNNEHSVVTIKNNKFITFQWESTSARGYDVDLTDISPQTRIVFENNAAGFISWGSWIDSGLGIVVGPSSNAELVKKMPYLSGAVEYRGINDSDFRVTSVGMQDYFVEEAPNVPTILSLGANTTAAHGSLAIGTYFYRVQAFTLIGNSGVSAEDSVVVSNDDSVSIMSVNAGIGYAMLRVWRGTATLTYDRYVDIPVISRNVNQLYDSGTHFMGFPWITAGVPAASVSLAYGGTYINGAKHIKATASPATGTWSKGDTATNNSPNVGDLVQWYCTTAGTPGTWSGVRQAGLVTAVTGTPSYIGQLAMSGDHIFVSTATTSPGSWKQIDN